MKLSKLFKILLCSSFFLIALNFSTLSVQAVPTNGDGAGVGPNGQTIGGNGNTTSGGSSNAGVGQIDPTVLGVPTKINDIISSVVQLAYAVAGLVFFFMLLFGGIRYLSAGGDEKAAAAARGTLTNAVIGLIIVVAAFLITQLLFSIFKIQGIKLG